MCHTRRMTTPPQFPDSGYQYPEPSQATTALVLGIIGLPFLCGLVAPFAWYIGQKELNAIDSGMRDPVNRSTAQAGKVLGIVGTVFLGIGVAFGLVFLALLIFGLAVG